MSSKNEVEGIEQLHTDPDYILIKRFKNSLAKVVERYPDGAPDRIIGQALGMSDLQVQETYARVIDRLRSIMSVEG
jgi:hypothetical protein